MAIEIGQILDKYELLEEVGQGGMAVVYRGLDRSLRREVAVKVLHKHLADHKEARDRFEREAHAVAKLRHENILEIFDFSGTDSEESYIVTEFIEGQTLKQFLNEHRIGHPEVGALITLQVCRALNHAHGLGILHRDVKPENIMIRNDGVVKLTDFGIAQMIDLQRMTVTGQLLGSPAYMSPEHVEGKPLDFRTDVFSVGILLYQLVTGKLPFTGRNPHEILKRIAECSFRPPEQVNLLVGKELGGIIAKAMARAPDDRYPDISSMLVDLQRYLHGSGLRDFQDESARFFAAPASYELALRARLVDALTRGGRELLAENRVAALEKFNRVLTMDPENEEVLEEIDKLSRRRRSARILLLVVGVIAVAGLGLIVRALMPSGEAGASGLADAAASDAAIPLATPPDALPALSAPADAGTADASSATDARSAAANQPDRPHTNHSIDRPPKRHADAGITVLRPAPRSVTLIVFPRNSEYRIGDGAWTRINGTRVSLEVDGAESEVEVRNQACCVSDTRAIPTLNGGVVDVTLGWLPAEVVPVCDLPGARVQIDNREAELGSAVVIPIGSSTTGQRTVEIAFYTDDGKHFKKERVRVRYKESKVVKCAF